MVTRRFGLSHKNAGGNVERFRTARSMMRVMAQAMPRMTICIMPDVIENREQRTNKDDDREHLKGKDKTDVRGLLAQRSKHKLRAEKRVAQALLATSPMT